MSATSVPTPYRRTAPKAPRPNPTTEFSALLGEVRDAGLLRRRTGSYLALTAVLLLALGLDAWGILELRNSWWQLALAAIMGLLLAQFGYLAHEAAHREIFTSGPANDRFGRILADLIVGISYSWWKVGHNRHHANPNRVGKDPSVEAGVFSFTREDSARARGVYAWYLRKQAYFYYPILLLAGLNLYLQSFATVFGRAPIERRWQEIVMLVARTGGLLALLGFAMSVGKTLAFLGVQLAVFGIATASSFVVNHVGMPVIAPDAQLDYLKRQVTTSRNIRGGWIATAWMGGLNFQIEHHLFPSMPRANLRAASGHVKRFCAERGIPYTETGVLEAYLTVGRYMNDIGRTAGRSMDGCPTARMLGR